MIASFASYEGLAVRLRRAAAAAGLAALASCGASVERDVERLRGVTAPYRVLDSAVAAGYAREVRSCLAHPSHGAMGFHHVNRALVDDRVEPDRPEILLYSRTAEGEYRLNGVEYIVPYSVRPRESEPPTVMGRRLKQSDSLRLWYLHVWVWAENPAGRFADWNPAVRC
jgi:hypothetical protein